MSENKDVVERYMEGFRRSDHAMILSCLTDDVVWDMPGAFHLVGKEAFDREVENPAFTGRPTITISRVIEENGVVVANTLILAMNAWSACRGQRVSNCARPYGCGIRHEDEKSAAPFR